MNLHKNMIFFIFLNLFFFVIGWKVIGWKFGICCCSKIPHYSEEIFGRLNELLKYSLEKNSKTVMSKLEKNSENINIHSEKPTNAFHMVDLFSDFIPIGTYSKFSVNLIFA